MDFNTDFENAPDFDPVTAVVCICMFTFAVFALVSLYKCVRYVCFVSREVRARSAISDYHAGADDLDVIVAGERVDAGVPPAGPLANLAQGAPRVRVRRGALREMQIALATSAQFEFGFHPEGITEAWRLVHRSFMVRELKDFKDLRKGDALKIIDGAMPLSFLPSETLREMNGLVDTYSWSEAADPSPHGRWPWYLRVFVSKPRVAVA